jgi:hypothetical protein
MHHRAHGCASSMARFWKEVFTNALPDVETALILQNIRTTHHQGPTDSHVDVSVDISRVDEDGYGRGEDVEARYGWHIPGGPSWLLRAMHETSLSFANVSGMI